jgi:hypothetical protein
MKNMTLIENEPIDEIHFYQYLADKTESEMISLIDTSEGEIKQELEELHAKLKKWQKKTKKLEKQTIDDILNQQLEDYLKTL